MAENPILEEENSEKSSTPEGFGDNSEPQILREFEDQIGGEIYKNEIQKNDFF